MIWFILYVLIAAAATFGFCYARMTFFDYDTRHDDLFAPILCGVFWPAAGPVYAAYLVAAWLVFRKE